MHRQSISSGEVCEVRYGAKGIHDPQAPVRPITRAAAVAAAEDFLRDFDFTTIDVAAAVARLPGTAVEAALVHGGGRDLRRAVRPPGAARRRARPPGTAPDGRSVRDDQLRRWFVSGPAVTQRAAVRAAVRDTSADLLGYFERRVTPREDAADLLAETLLTAWRRVDRLPAERERQRMWLFTIAAHVLANHRRSARRRLALGDRLRGHLATATPAPGPEDAEAVRDAVLRLPETQRELVALVHWDGFTLAEAAEILGVNASTARSRYAVAKATLHESLVGVGAAD